MEVNAIDGHRHIVLKEAIAAASKLNPVKSTHIYPSGLNERSEQINRGKGGEWDRKMADLEENLAGALSAVSWHRRDPADAADDPGPNCPRNHLPALQWRG